jgi:hypothetical protein
MIVDHYPHPDLPAGLSVSPVKGEGLCISGILPEIDPLFRDWFQEGLPKHTIARTSFVLGTD